MAAVPWWTEKPGLSVGLFSFGGVLVGASVSPGAIDEGP